MTEARRFKVAFSFPDEHRAQVAAIADALVPEFGCDGVLYDKYHPAEFARLDLDLYLPKLYRTEAELIVLVLCPEYANKRWCMLELRHVRQIFATRDSFRVMPLIIGDPGDLSDIGILPGDGRLDITDMPAKQVAAHIRKRLDLNARPSGAGRRALEFGASFAAAPIASTSPASESGALRLWRKKLEHLLEAEVLEDDAARRFKLTHQIEEARRKIAEFEGQR